MPSSGIPSCHVSKDTYLEQGHENKFSLTPRRIPVERKTPAAKREVDQDMVAKEESVSDAESGWSGVSDNSSTDSECTDVEACSVASDQDRFDTAYDAFRDLANDLYHIDLRRYSRGVTSEDAAGVPLLDGQEKLQELVHLPQTWPLARLTIPLEGLTTEAPLRWNRFFQQLADPKTALQPWTEMHLPMFKNEECRCTPCPQFQCCWKQPQQSHHPKQKTHPYQKSTRVHNTEIRRGAGRLVIQSNLHYNV